MFCTREHCPHCDSSKIQLTNQSFEILQQAEPQEIKATITEHHLQKFWFQDEASVGQRGTVTRTWAAKVSRARLTRQQQLFTMIKSNMKQKLMSVRDKLLLRKRSLIETVNDQLKNISQIEHTRHRSRQNFLVNLLAGIAAYDLQPKKPSLNLEELDNTLMLI